MASLQEMMDENPSLSATRDRIGNAFITYGDPNGSEIKTSVFFHSDNPDGKPLVMLSSSPTGGRYSYLKLVPDSGTTMHVEIQDTQEQIDPLKVVEQAKKGIAMLLALGGLDWATRTLVQDRVYDDLHRGDYSLGNLEVFAQVLSLNVTEVIDKGPSGMYP